MNLPHECIVFIGTSLPYLECKNEESFLEGVELALTTPQIYESANLIPLDEALAFAEWAQYECIRINGDWQLGKEYYTTTQLYTLFKQETHGK